METTNSKAKVLAAFTQAQREFPVVEMSKTVSTGKFSYKYAPLSGIMAAITPVLSKHGLSVLTPMTGNFDISVIIAHESGEHLEFQSALPDTVKSAIKDAKAGGAAITYFRRYFLCAALGIVSDEDTDAVVVDGDERQILDAYKQLTPEEQRKEAKRLANLKKANKYTRTKVRSQMASFQKKFDQGLEPIEIYAQMKDFGMAVDEETMKALQELFNEYLQAKKEHEEKGDQPKAAKG